MSMGIQTQSEQFGGFADDPAKYSQRDRVAVFEIDGDVHDYLLGPSITAGYNDTRRSAGFGAYPDSNSFAREDLSGHGGYDEEEPHSEEGFMQESPPEDPYAGHDPHAIPVQPLDQFQEQHHPDDFSHYHNAEPPGHFNQARRRTADDAGSDFQAFNTGLYTPGDKLDSKSQMLGGEPERWPTAAAAPMAPPAAPAAPVWLGHAYAPAHRVGMPWRGKTLPGTVTHLDGTNVGVRWDDGQHSTEEPSAIHPLY